MSMVPPLLLDVQRGDQVLDLCALSLSLSLTLTVTVTVTLILTLTVTLTRAIW